MCVLQNEKTAAAAKLEAVRNDLAHAQADKLYLEEQLARVSARLHGAPCWVAGVGLSSRRTHPELRRRGSCV